MLEALDPSEPVEVASEVEEHHELVVGTGLDHAQQLGGLAGADRAGHEDARVARKRRGQELADLARGAQGRSARQCEDVTYSYTSKRWYSVCQVSRRDMAARYHAG
ncbi:MAG TPA: hypothetical protein VF516_32365 [Kofleriaceae bacterium]